MAETGATSLAGSLSGNERQFLFLREILDFFFPFARLGTGIRGFLVYQADWPSRAGVFRTVFCAVVFAQTPFQVSGYPGVQRFIRTPDDIDAPTPAFSFAHW